MKKIFLSLLALVACQLMGALSAQAAVRLPRILSDGVVLQRNDTIRIWGWADAGEKVQVKLNKKGAVTTAGHDGKWMVALPPHKAGGPYTLTVNEQTVKDVYVGDVWLISGQSNIDVHIERVHRIYEKEVYSESNPKIHLIQLDRALIGDGERDDIGPGSYPWQAMNPDPKIINHWSALSYFFMKEMYAKTGVPQGVINASLGGSNIIAWLNRENMERINPRYIQQLDHLMQPGYLERNARINGAIGKVYNQLMNDEDPGLQGKWMNEDIDDTDWEVVNQFARNIGDENGRTWKGTLWFRKTFEVPADKAGQEATLFLGYMVDADDSYINGTHVGSTGYEYPPRIYKVPAGLLKAGKNTVAIRLRTNGNPMKFQHDKPYRVVFGNIYEKPEACTVISLEGDFKMKRGVLMPNQPGVEGISNGCATVLHNGQIAPLKNLNIAGIVWYQGETNVGNPKEYAILLPALMNQWRGIFGQHVPVVICSLANYLQRHEQPVQSNQAEMRNIQRRTALEIGNAGLANLADLGEWNDIHPWRKKEAAHRVFAQMNALYLKTKGAIAEGPACESMQVENGKAIISFKANTGKLVALKPVVKQQAAFVAAETLPVDESGNLLGFTLAGQDGKFYNAQARIVNGQVEVWSTQVPEPVVVRYGWDDNPVLSLYNELRLPAAPFELSVSK
ncbi:MAG: sialate O-acetylesterase [Bacteroidales bacterium]|nr:sialate O-acetylesterase [Bacteroidales bacterium]